MAIEHYDLPPGVDVEPAEGYVAVRREEPPACHRPINLDSRRARPMPVGVEIKTGRRVMWDETVSIVGWCSLDFGSEQFRGPETLLIPVSAIRGTVVESIEPKVEPAPAPVKRKRVAPPQESDTQALARAEAEQAAREALENAMEGSET